MNIILQKLPSCWEAIPQKSGLKSGLKLGIGSSVDEAVGNLVLANPEYFGLGNVQFDMACPVTREHVERLELPRVLVNTNGKIPLPFTF